MVTISAALKHTYEFACHSAACRPPSSGGTGGSTGGKGGGGGGSTLINASKAVANRSGGGGAQAARAAIQAKSINAVKAMVNSPKGGGGGGGTPTESMPTWAKRAGMPAHATVKGNVATIKNEDGSVTKITHAKNSKGLHKFATKTTKDGYTIHEQDQAYSKGYGGAQAAAKTAARHAATDKSQSVKAMEKDYGVRRKDADPNSLQARYKGRAAGVRFPKDLQTNAAGDIVIKSGGGYNPNAGAKLGTIARQESGKGWQGTLEDGKVVKSKTRAGVLAATVRYIQK